MCVTTKENNNEGPLSGRDVDLLEDVVDPDAPEKWQCCASSAPFTLLSASGKSSNPCALSKFDETDSGFKARAEQWNFENKDSCDVVVRITDKGGAVSSDSVVHVNVEDVNDPPQGLAMKGICEIEENTPLNQQLPSDSTRFCELTATDEDDVIFTFLKSTPAKTTGTKGHFFSELAGSTDEDKWDNVRYFSVETNGKFTVSQVPDYETAESVSFDVYARDSRGRLSASKTITVGIKDVNEPPIIAAAMRPVTMAPPLRSGRVDGDNKLCTANFATAEYKKNGGWSTPAKLFMRCSAPTGLLATALKFAAVDPDQGATNAQWRTVKYSLTAGHFDSDIFSIDAGDGTIKPNSSKLEFLV